MGWLTALGGIMGLVGSMQSYGQDQSAYNSATQAAGQDAAAQSGLFSSVENTLGGAWGNASNYWLNESKQGLDPAVIASAMNSFNTSNSQQLASIKNQFGGALPNLSGTLEDMRAQDLQGGEALGGQLAAQNQGVRDQAMNNYFGGALNLSSPLLNIAGQYGQAGSAAQQNAMYAMNGMQQNNPFSYAGNFLSGMSFGGPQQAGGMPGGGPWQYGATPWAPGTSPFGAPTFNNPGTQMNLGQSSAYGYGNPTGGAFSPFGMGGSTGYGGGPQAVGALGL